jgi:hypothetical protein
MLDTASRRQGCLRMASLTSCKVEMIMSMNLMCFVGINVDHSCKPPVNLSYFKQVNGFYSRAVKHSLPLLTYEE